MPIPNILQFKKKLNIFSMYYFPNTYFYPINGQLFMLPQIVQSPNLIFPGSDFKKQLDTQQPSQQKKITNSHHEPDSHENKHLTTVSKNIQQKQHRETVDSDYEPEKNQLLIFYKKKNTESNLSNQIYSFISSQKSQPLMLMVFQGSEEKVEDLYKVIRKIKKTNKKYMNRAYISELILLREDGTNYKIFKRSKSILTAQEIRKALRISFRYFIKNVCDSGLLTSKKMNKCTLMEHFVRKREIMAYMQSQMLEEEEK